MQKYYRKNKYTVSLYPKELFKKLEFDKVLALLTEKCVSPLGKRYVERIKIQSDPAQIQKMLNQVHEFKQLLMLEEQPFPSNDYIDIYEELKYLQIQNFVLQEHQMFRIYKMLQTMHGIFLYFEGKQIERRDKYPELFALLRKLEFNKVLLVSIKDILTDEGKIRSDASKELLQIRRSINQSYQDLERKFRSIIQEYRKLGYLADTEESVRNGRRVLAVLAERKRKVKGIIHDESSTGQTTFIEPEATVQISNEIVGWQQAEKREIYRILKALTDKIRPHVEVLQQYQKILGLFDFIRAKGQLAWDMDAHRPRLADDKTIEVFNARHPLLYLKNKAEKKKVVPLSFSLSIAERILVISGPNAGGKSVLLKTVGLLQLMLQAGLLVPLNDHSIMSIFRHIFVDIGDEQSIENDLSTYSSHLQNMRYFTEHANAKTLILMDEFGSGTDPALGGAIAEAILEQLNKKFCYGIITTHYSNLKVYASNTKGIINGCMTFDLAKMSPLYKLEVGKPGSSFAFELATNSGLSRRIIQKAKSKVDHNYKEFDELLSTLQREKQEVMERERIVQQKEGEFKRLLAEYKSKQDTLDKERKEILLKTQEQALGDLKERNRKFEHMVKEWSENKGEKKLVKQIKTEIEEDKKQLNSTIEILKDKIYYRDSTEPIIEGCSVRLRAGGKEIGIVVELRKNRAVVSFGELRTQAKTKDLVKVEPVESKEKPRQQNWYSSLEERSAFDSNIDIRGMRRDEALQTVETLLDDAIIYNADELKIIHGIGDGILRRSIRQMLRGYQSVKSVRDEDPQYGGQGVSIVELK